MKALLVFASLTTTVLMNSAIAAPSIPAIFFDVDLATLTENIETYRASGLGLQTLTSYYVDGKLVHAGVFDKRVVTPQVHAELPREKVWETYDNHDGLAFRELSVTVFEGKPTFTILMQKHDMAQKPVFGTWGVDDTQFASNSQLARNMGMRIISHFPYRHEGVNKHTAVFMRDNKQSILKADLTKVGVLLKITEMASQGWQITSFSVTKTETGEDNYSAIFTMQSEATFAFFQIPKAQLLEQIRLFRDLGCSLVKLQGHHGGKTFSAIFARSLTP